MGTFPSIDRDISADPPLPSPEELFSTLVGSIDLAVALLDLHGVVLMWNPAAERITGWSADEAVGGTIPWVPPQRRVEFSRLLERVRGGETIRGAQLEPRRKDGSSLRLRLWAMPVLGPDDVNHVLAVIEDVTARTHAQEDEFAKVLRELRASNEARRRLLARLVHAQEEERRRIAADVHDDSIQKMVVAGMRLETLKLRYPALAADPQFGAIGEAISAAVAGLRHLIFELRPAVLDTSGLAAAVRWHVDQHRWGAKSVDAEVVNDITCEPPEDVRVILFRVAQEAIANVRKHANASRVSVHLEERDLGYSVRVIDDGVGFDPGSSEPMPGHLGLVDMRERVESASGRWDVRSRPGDGTTVEAWLPAKLQ
ncbi:MAG: PAS domain-containing sensor histidine kinase [Actinobacteria bacterium]|nr:PAS domain-containing sensor histidine kinase [Actinomycetota bacterium]